jgi:hypothetical protein
LREAIRIEPVKKTLRPSERQLIQKPAIERPELVHVVSPNN